MLRLYIPVNFITPNLSVKVTVIIYRLQSEDNDTYFLAINILLHFNFLQYCRVQHF